MCQPLDEAEPRVGSFSGEEPSGARSEDELGEVGGRDREDALGLGRVERLRWGGQLDHPLEEGPKRVDDAGQSRSRLHGPHGGDEERVREELAKTLQLMAHRGLRDPHPLGGLRDAGGSREHVQGHQEVEVEPPECIDVAHGDNEY